MWIERFLCAAGVDILFLNELTNLSPTATGSLGYLSKRRKWKRKKRERERERERDVRTCVQGCVCTCMVVTACLSVWLRVCRLLTVVGNPGKALYSYLPQR
jgi:hypothetical protein